jgi:uncharacterized protein YjbJ (UPF0337 family)
MSEDRIEGNIRNAAGRLQDAVGGITGDTGTQVEGKARALAGKAQASYGEAIDCMRDMAAEKPLAALGVATAVGFVIGALWTRRD